MSAIEKAHRGELDRELSRVREELAEERRKEMSAMEEAHRGELDSELSRVRQELSEEHRKNISANDICDISYPYTELSLQQQDVLEKYSLNTSTHLELEANDLLPPINNVKVDGRKSFKRLQSRQQRHTGDKSGVKVKKCSNCNSYEHTSLHCNIELMGEEEKKLYLRDQVMIKEQASRIDYIKSNYKDSIPLAKCKNEVYEESIARSIAKVNDVSYINYEK
jgi:hypothetical protein